MTERPCGPKKTKTNNAYTKEELIEIALNFGIISSKSEANKKSVKELCDAIGIDTNTKVEKKTSREGTFAESCELSKQKLYDIYKEKKLGEKNISDISKDELCNLIFPEPSKLTLPTEFNDKICNKYSLTELREFGKTLKIDNYSTDSKEDLCRSLKNYSYITKNKIVFNMEKDSNWKGLDTCWVPFNKDLKLVEHQQRIAQFMVSNRSLLAVHSVGSGKTLSAVASINCVMGQYPNIKVIIITPLSLKENFKTEMKKFGIDLDEVKYSSRIKLFSYDTFVNYYKSHQDTCENTFLIVDEAHNLRSEIVIKQQTNKQTGDNEPKIKKGMHAFYIMQCASSALKVLLLSATPLVNRPSDLINLSYMLEGKKYDENDIKTLTKELKKGAKGVGNDIIANLFKCKVSVFTVNQDDTYPTRINMPITYLPMSDDYYKRYHDIELKVLETYDVLCGSSPMFYSSLRRAVNALDGVDSPKIQEIVKFIVSESKAGRKSLVYSNWQNAGMNLLRQELDKQSQKNLYNYISGELTEKERTLNKKSVNEGKSKILLISKAGAEGISLIEIRNVIIMESNWNAATDEQIIGRAIRKNSHIKLPKDQQNVKVFRYMMKKPAKRVYTDEEIDSIDQILYDMGYIKKLPLIQQYTKILENVSIEKNKCTGNKFDTIPSKSEFTSISSLKKEKPVVAPVPKVAPYIAPLGISTLAIEPSEVGMSIYNKLAGIQASSSSSSSSKKKMIVLKIVAMKMKMKKK